MDEQVKYTEQMRRNDAMTEAKGSDVRAACECHECTQARWNQSFAGQLHNAMNTGRFPIYSPEGALMPDQPSKESLERANQESK